MDPDNTSLNILHNNENKAMKNTIESTPTNTQETKQKLIQFLESRQSEGHSLDKCVRSGAELYPDLERADGVEVFMSVFGVEAWHADTIYCTCYRPTIIASPDSNTQIESPVFPEDTNLRIELIRIALSEAAGNSQGLFLDCTVPILREAFLKRGGVSDNGRGCVYAYFNGEQALYVGITGSRVKSRLKTPTSPHEQAEWWPEWTHMRFLPLPLASDRLILEYLLILGLAPIANKKPGAVTIETFLKDLEGDLLCQSEIRHQMEVK